MLGEGDQQEQPGIDATRRWSSKAMRMRSGWWRGSIFWVLVLWDRFFATKPLSQIQRSTLLLLQQASHTPSFGGFRFSGENSLE